MIADRSIFSFHVTEGHLFISISKNNNPFRGAGLLMFSTLTDTGIVYVFREQRSRVLGLWYFSSSLKSSFKRVGPFVGFRTSCVGTAKALARLRRHAGMHWPLWVSYAVGTMVA